jgi:hypothetical protein
MPRLILRSRAYQLAHDPESLVRMTRSGRRGDSSHVMGAMVSRSRWRGGLSTSRPSAVLAVRGCMPHLFQPGSAGLNSLMRESQK